MKRLLSLLTVLLGLSASAWAVDVTVTMNSSARTMTLTNKATGTAVEVGDPTTVSGKNQYQFTADEGTYVLTGFDSKGVNYGTIELPISDESSTFQIWTASFKATNSKWVVNTDYTVENYSVRTREGDTMPITLGENYDRALVINGGTFNCTFVPSESRKAEGYMDAYGSATFTANATTNGSCPLGGTMTITYPADANFALMRKEGGSNGSGSIHYVRFPEIAPVSTTTAGGVTTAIYTLGESNTYNYRLWQTGKRTKAAMFVFSASTMNHFDFTDADLDADPKAIDHDPASNNKYNVGNILVNINERGHLSMKSGEVKNLLAQRDWQLTNSSTANYFIEPDYHYTIVNLDGTPITIDNADTTTDPWATLHANSKGTALVLVTYDAIQLTQWTKAGAESPYLGGADWGASWPENTAVFVVTVDEQESAANPNMTLNAEYNDGAKRLAGQYVDAEHDVFYYLDTDPSATYTFTPEGITKVEIANPEILTNTVSYGAGFKTVEANADGSYTLSLPFGRSIVRMTDASGAAIYQVLTAKPIHRDIQNVTRPGSTKYMPGDKVKIQYSGLYHPANKMSGIYNMSAYITYNGVPTGTSLILSANQYTFAGTPSAQAVNVHIPSDWNMDEATSIELADGVIQVNGYGDPIGNHRNISRIGGRSPNFTAIAHKTYFGNVPSVSLPIFVADITLQPTYNIDEEVTLVLTDPQGQAIAPNEDGTFSLIKYGDYRYKATAEGYTTLTGKLTIPEDCPAITTLELSFTEGEAGWDGQSMTEPELADGAYQISNGAELAWFANEVNANRKSTINAVLTADIQLADNPWNRIGTSTALAYKGTFDGQGHTIRGLYINATAGNLGLFGYVNGATIQNLTIDGVVKSTGSSIGAFAGYATANTKFVNLYNKADVSGSTYVAGIVGQVRAATNSFTNCANSGTISASGNYAGGIAAMYSTAYATPFNGVVNAGNVTGTNYVGSIYGCSNANAGQGVSQAYTNISVNASETNVTLVSDADMLSGKVAMLLGEPWGQEIGVDPCPTPFGMPLFTDADGSPTNVYTLYDATEYTASADTHYAKFAYSRSFDDTEWQPLYVPFESQYDDWSDIADIARADNLRSNGRVLVIEPLASGDVVEANTPYFVRAKNQGRGVVSLEDVTLLAATDASVDVNGLTITGTYAAKHIEPGSNSPLNYIPSSSVLTSGSITMVKNPSGYDLSPMRWYAKDAKVVSVKLHVVGEDDVETDIQSLDLDSTPSATYSIDGVRQQSLRKGVNIIRTADGNIRKVMVK